MGDKVTIKEAAQRVGKGVSTLRRWMQQGHLTRHEGEPPPGRRGSPPVLVDMNEVLHRAAQLGVSVVAAPEEAAPPEDAAPADTTVEDLRRELERARAAQLEAELRGQIATLEAQRDGLEARLADTNRRVSSLESDRAYLREVVAAKEAELEHMRALEARGWFSRVFGLLSGPSDG